MAMITDPLIIKYRSIVLRAVKTSMPLNIGGGVVIPTTDKNISKEMMDFTWQHWINPMRPTFLKYFQQTLGMAPEQFIHDLQHQSSLLDTSNNAVNVFCGVVFPQFVERCMQDIDDTIHNKYMVSAFRDHPPGSKKSLVDFIDGKYPKEKKAGFFFGCYRSSFLIDKPLRTIPVLLPTGDQVLDQKPMPQEMVPHFIAKACGEILQEKEKAKAAAKISSRQEVESSQQSPAPKKSTIMM